MVNAKWITYSERQMANTKRKIVLICHNIRSCHNVGSLLRTADGLGITHVFMTGYTPYPRHEHDSRLPHISRKVHMQIQKTALGAAETVPWSHVPDIFSVIEKLKQKKYLIAGLEQTPYSVDVTKWSPGSRTAIVIGRETEGIEPEVLEKCTVHLEIPMLGKKESFNVVQATAMALYHCRFYKPC